MGGSARIVSIYFTTEEMDAINTLCKKTTQTPQTIIKKSVIQLLEKTKSNRQAPDADRKSEASTT